MIAILETIAPRQICTQDPTNAACTIASSSMTVWSAICKPRRPTRWDGSIPGGRDGGRSTTPGPILQNLPIEILPKSPRNIALRCTILHASIFIFARAPGGRKEWRLMAVLFGVLIKSLTDASSTGTSIPDTRANFVDGTVWRRLCP